MANPDAWAIECCSTTIKQAARDKLAKDIAAFLAAGGQLDQRTMGETSGENAKTHSIMQIPNQNKRTRNRPITSKQKQILRMAMDCAIDGEFNRRDIRKQLGQNDGGNLQCVLQALCKKGYVEPTGVRNFYKIIKTINTSGDA